MTDLLQLAQALIDDLEAQGTSDMDRVAKVVRSLADELEVTRRLCRAYHAKAVEPGPERERELRHAWQEWRGMEKK